MAIQEDIFRLEEELKRLIREYEKYFLGIERREPTSLQDSLERLIKRYSVVPITNTMMKFRYNALVARYNTYKQYWYKTNLLIENGKYSRDKFKMEMRELSRAIGKDEPSVPPESDDEITRIHRQYLEARKTCNLPDKEISPDSIKSLLDKQKPLLLQKYNCRNLEFKVVVEDGAPKIKAIPLP